MNLSFLVINLTTKSNPLSGDLGAGEMITANKLPKIFIN